MKVAIAQQNYKIGRFDYNYIKIERAIQHAILQKVDLIIFGELAVCGYSHYDDIFYSSFLDQTEVYLQKIALLSQHIDILIGAPTKNTTDLGKGFFNCIYLLKKGEKKYCIHKTLLSNFDIFKEEKYYERGNNNTATVQIGDKRTILSICADMWAYRKMNTYTKNPIKHIGEQYPSNLIVNISASPFHYSKLQQRVSIIQRIIKDLNTPMIYCNIVGAYDDIVFDGQSLVFNEDGQCVVQMKAFDEDIQIIDLNKLPSKHIKIEQQSAISTTNTIPDFLTSTSVITSIHDCILRGIKDFLSHLNIDKVIIASSGGIDSAVCLAMVSKVVSKKNILSLSLPSRFNSKSTQADAQKLANQLGIQHLKIPIDDTCEQLITKMKTSYNSNINRISSENIQSRIRCLIAMTVANNEESILINTSNKSELSTGYGTLYGDMTGAISLLGDLFKLQVYALAHYLNQDTILIPKSIINREPSAELSHNQKDSDSLPPYETLDSILYCLIHLHEGKKEIINRGFDTLIVERIIQLYKKAEFKRKQFCPIIRVSNKAFGQGRKNLITSNFVYI